MTRFPWKQGLFTLACLAVLCGLGTWQLYRLAWKEAIIKKLEAEYGADAAERIWTARDIAEKDAGGEAASYGRAEGHFLIDKAVLAGPVPQDGRIGYNLVLPLELEDRTVLIVRGGWVGDLWKDNPQERLAILPHGNVIVRGVLRKPDYNRFSSSNAPDRDLWFTIAPREIAAAKGTGPVYDAVLYADTITPPLPGVEISSERWLPRNKHLQYALFWYTLALAMAAVFGVYAWKGTAPREP